MRVASSVKAFGVFALSVLVLVGCSDKGPPLKGKRVSVLDMKQALSVDFLASREKVFLPKDEKSNKWTQSGGNACKAWFPLRLGSLNKKVFSVRVGAPLQSNPGIVSEPIVSDFYIYTVDGNSVVHAVDLSTGKVAWKANINPAGLTSNGQRGGVVFDEGTLYGVSPQGHLVALDATNGALKWRSKVDGLVRAAPTVDNGRILVLTASNKVFAFDYDSGGLLWSHEGVPEQTRIVGSACPAIYEDVALVPYSSGELYAFRVENGYMLWSDVVEGDSNKETLASLPHIRSNPVIDFEKAFVVSHGGPLVAFDLRTGERVWEKHVGSISTPFVTGNSLFIVTTNNELACISRDKGGVRWVKKLPQPEKKGFLQKGRVNWYGPVVVSGRRIIVNSSSGQVLALSADNGSVVSEYQLPGAVEHGPVIAKGRAYFVTKDAQLVAIE